MMFPIVSSCAGNIQSTKAKKFKWPLQSFVKIENLIYKMKCTPDDVEDLNSECYAPRGGSTGSGAVVGRTKTGSYVITAGHICERGGEKIESIESIVIPDNTNKQKHITRNFFFVYDWDYFKYSAEVLDIDNEEDLCLLHVWGLFAKPLYLSKKRPKRGDKVYSMAAPGGIFQKNTAPLFEGLFSGMYNHYEFDKKAMYTMPVLGGMSGAAIMNEKGALVGVISAGYIRFHHIMLGTRYSPTIRFILRNVKRDMKIRGREAKDSKAVRFK
tara:strand:- start:7101 stop:7910 length:810 start_codon:yes stop_codon:yes gene_type:complete